MDADEKRLMILYEGVKTKARVSKVVILNNNHVLLMQKHGSLKWELPGGHATSKESMIEGACREVKEETGIVLDTSKLRKIQASADKKNKYKTCWYIYTEPVKQKIRLSDEHVNYKWVSKIKLDNYELSQSTNHLAIVSSYDR